MELGSWLKRGLWRRLRYFHDHDVKDNLKIGVKDNLKDKIDVKDNLKGETGVKDNLKDVNDMN